VADGVEFEPAGLAAPELGVAHDQTHEDRNDQRREHRADLSFGQPAALHHPQHAGVAHDVERRTPFAAMQRGEWGNHKSRSQPGEDQRVPEVPAAAEIARPCAIGEPDQRIGQPREVLRRFVKRQENAQREQQPDFETPARG